MKSNTQQVVSIFLVVCLLVFCAVGAITDGFSDFSMFEYKPLEMIDESKNDFEYCSSVVSLASDVATDFADRITWENERVEFSAELVSGDVNADTGFSISEDGIFSLTNVDYYKSMIDNNRYSRIYIHVGCQTAVSVSGSFDIKDITDLTHFDLLRSICKTFTLVEDYYVRDDVEDTSCYISILADIKSGGYIEVSNLDYKLTFKFLDRISDRDSRIKVPSVEDGYIFDGWYNDEALTSYYGKDFNYPSISGEDRHFYYIDEIKFPKVSPAVTLSFVSYGHTSSVECAVGTVISEVQSISVLNLMRELNSHADNVYFTNEDGMVLSKHHTADIVFDKDMTFTSNCMFASYDLNFYIEGEVFYTYKIEIGTVLDTSLIPAPERAGYDIEFYYTDRDGNEFEYNGEEITYPYDFNVKYVLHTYTAKLYRQRATAGDPSGALHYELTDTVEFHFNDHDFNAYLSTVSYGSYYWQFVNGTAYNSSANIFEDISLYQVFVPDKFTLTVKYGSCYEAFYGKNTVEYEFDYGTNVNLYSLDIVKDKIGYIGAFGYCYGPDNFVAYTNPQFNYVYMDKDNDSYYVYVPIVYTVTFNSEYDLDIKTSTFTCETGIALPTMPAREGFDFVGWHFKDGTAYDNSKIYYEDLDLYEKWQIQRKTITLMSDGVLQWSFTVDYGTALEDVMSVIKEKNYNVVSFTSANFREDKCFIGEATFEVQAMDKADSIKNTIKNKWQIIVLAIAGVLLFFGILSIMPKFKRRRR